MTNRKTASGPRSHGNEGARPLAAIVLAAGRSTRMQSDLPKVLHRLAGRTILGHLIDNLALLKPDRTYVVIAPDGEAVAHAAPGAVPIAQADARGTGDAVQRVREALADFDGDVLVLYGDSPFLKTDTMRAMIEALHAPSRPAVVVLGFEAALPHEYGRLVLDARGNLTRIVSARDATAEERTITLCNSGMMAGDRARLFDLLSQVGSDNAQGEVYLTDVVEIAHGRGQPSAVIRGDISEMLGVNTRAELAAAEAIVQERLRAQAMASGATLLDPGTVYFSHDTRVGRDVVIEPNVLFGPGVTLADGAIVCAFSHIEGASIGPGASVGPFARLRPGTRLEAGARIGNFVEAKNVQMGEGAKANHLTYLGDTVVGERANIGAGTITCNYDGYTKSQTAIGAHAFVGSNTALVAPVKVGEGAVVGAGSVITRDVKPGALALTRPPQHQIEGWAEERRQSRTKAPAHGAHAGAKDKVKEEP
ncbi:MAG: bifunctional UDP-N-acetylglucosamine diphosphorylase/glucosamine-1-phosphate N-acetyltransferase GlmU [Alphaproteobacteria bacterium]|nr:bifunctional UDP-N-acetylglucosamine diphosphorylase/glucosamine-1-phosphate N-acetyltransferase GlmU [Alphaproteobacteria bacterium]